MLRKFASVSMILFLVLASFMPTALAASTSPSITVKSISEKYRGNDVAVSGTTTLSEVNIKVINAMGTIIYVNTVKPNAQGVFSDLFTVMNNEVFGMATVIVGEGNVVANTKFEIVPFPAPPPPPPTSEVITVPVESGNSETGSEVSQTPITRTTDTDGQKKDAVVLTSEAVTETIGKLKEQGADKARIVIPDNEDIVKEVKVDIPKNSVALLNNGKIDLEISTQNVKISIPQASMANFPHDLYFRLVPIKADALKKQVEERAKKEKIVQEVVQNKEVNVLGRPMTIETNMQSRLVTLVLPLKDSLPTNASERQNVLNNLVIFIEHSDGSKELKQGKIVKYSNGTEGIEFDVNKFSTFTMVYMNGAAEYFAKDSHTPYINGFKDGTFRPDETVNRAQMAAMLVRNLDISYSGTTSYKDTKGSFAFKEIEMARKAGIIMGYEDGTFKPGQAITRAQMAVIASRWIKNECKQDATSDFCKDLKNGVAYKDVASGHWASAEIQHVTKTGIMQGFTGSSFKPEQSLTRAQAVVVLNRLFERGTLVGVSKPSFKDVPVGHWAYQDIEEASTDHLISKHSK